MTDGTIPNSTQSNLQEMLQAGSRLPRQGWERRQKSPPHMPGLQLGLHTQNPSEDLGWVNSEKTHIGNAKGVGGGRAGMDLTQP